MNTKIDPTTSGRRAAATVTVSHQGVHFGPKCWISHERITGLSAEALNSGQGGLIANQYLDWMSDALNHPGRQSITIKVDAAGLAARIDSTERAVFDILAERDRQDKQWGGPGTDDTRDAFDWLAYIEMQGDKLKRGLGEGQMPELEHARSRMVKIAALAMAAIESYDRLHPGTRDEQAEPDREEFGKTELLAMLDEAIEEGSYFKQFMINYYPPRARPPVSVTDISGKRQEVGQQSGMEAVKRAHDAGQKYLGGQGVQEFSVALDNDGSITIEAGS